MVIRWWTGPVGRLFGLQDQGRCLEWLGSDLKIWWSEECNMVSDSDLIDLWVAKFTCGWAGVVIDQTTDMAACRVTCLRIKLLVKVLQFRHPDEWLLQAEWCDRRSFYEELILVFSQPGSTHTIATIWTCQTRFWNIVRRARTRRTSLIIRYSSALAPTSANSMN